MAEKKAKEKAKDKGAKRDGGVKVKQTKSGEKIVKEKIKKTKEEKPSEKVKKSVEKKTEAETIEKKEGETAEKKEEKVEKKKVEKVKVEKPIVKIKNLAAGKIAAVRKGKPRFRRDELYKCKKLKDVWRSPRGLDGKKKEEKRGKGAVVKVGYKNPAGVYGIIKGFKAVRVMNVAELAGVDSKNQAVIIASSVGRKKRNTIIEEANKKNITILNPRKGEV